MNLLPAPFLSLGLASLLGTALLGIRSPKHKSSRTLAVCGAAVALLSLGTGALWIWTHPEATGVDPLLSWLRVDALNSLPLFSYCFLLPVILLMAPKRDSLGKNPSGLLLICAGTVTSYCASTLPVLVAGWWLTALPFATGLFGPSPTRWLSTAFLVASAAALSGFAWVTPSFSVAVAPLLSPTAFALLLLAIALRKGLFPLHSWVVTSFEHGPLIPGVFLFNGHLGALLIARAEAAQLREAIEPILHWLSVIALVTALIASFRAFAERTPRRLLGFLCVSQASFILAGLATSNPQGMTGALLHWLVVAVASSVLAGVLRILEVRVMDAANPQGHLGLALRAPKLATFFLVAALALVGLPGTIGYVAEDLLFHGALESHPWLGICLLAATAFNAINLLRLYAVLFLGVPQKHVIHIPDALARERWPLAMCAALLIAGGLFAGRILSCVWMVPERTHPHAQEHRGNDENSEKSNAPSIRKAAMGKPTAPVTGPFKTIECSYGKYADSHPWLV